MSGLTGPQSAYQATLVQQASVLASSVHPAGQQVPAEAPPGASQAETTAIGLEAQDAGTLAASLAEGGFSLGGTPPPSYGTPLEAPGTNQYQAGYNQTVAGQTSTLLSTLGIGTNTNTTA